MSWSRWSERANLPLPETRAFGTGGRARWALGSCLRWKISTCVVGTKEHHRVWSGQRAATQYGELERFRYCVLFCFAKHEQERGGLLLIQNFVNPEVQRSEGRIWKNGIGISVTSPLLPECQLSAQRLQPKEGERCFRNIEIFLKDRSRKKLLIFEI